MNKQEVIEIGAVVLAGVVLFMFLRHQGQSGIAPSIAGVDLTPPASPPRNYTNYNLAPRNSGAQNSLPSIQPATLAPAAYTKSPCACGQNSVEYASLNAFAGTLAAVESTVVDAYKSSILAAIPSWLGEFINNTFAPEESAAASGSFTSLAGLAEH